jgi:hypothetical protein
VTHFSDIYDTPKFGLSPSGDICFCNTTDGEPARNRQRRFFLNIYRADGSVSRTPLPNPPAMIEESLSDGISCLAPQIVNDHIYLGLAPDWMYVPCGSSYRVKVDWTGKILWMSEFSEDSFTCVHPIITPTGRQYILYESDKSKMLMCLSDNGEVQWTLREKWLNKLVPWMYSLPDECVLLAEDTYPERGGLSKLHVVNANGKVIIERNDFMQTLEQNNIQSYMAASYFHQSPIYPPQRSLVYFAHCIPYWGYETPQASGCPPKRTSVYDAPGFPYFDPDIPLRLFYDPQIVGLYEPMTDQLEKKEFLVGNVDRFLFDEETQVLYICADRKKDDISRIDFQNGSIQYHTYHGNHDTHEPEPPVRPDIQPKRKPYSRHNAESPKDYIYHCLPVMTEWGDVIFCHSGTTAICLSPEWKEKWRIELPRGACDIKLAGNLLFIMIFNKAEHRVELHKVLLLK